MAIIHSRSSGRGGAGNGASEGRSVADLERLEREEIAKVKRASTVSTSACVFVSPPLSISFFLSSCFFFLRSIGSQKKKFIHSPFTLSSANLVVRAGRGGFDATPAPTADNTKREQEEWADATRKLSTYNNVPYAVYRSAGRGGVGNCIPPIAENVAGPSGSGSSSHSPETPETPEPAHVAA